jgi:hypothetical protein
MSLGYYLWNIHAKLPDLGMWRIQRVTFMAAGILLIAFVLWIRKHWRSSEILQKAIRPKVFSVLLFTEGDADFWMTRELVGSLHPMLREVKNFEVRIIIAYCNANRHKIEVMTNWEAVELRKIRNLSSNVRHELTRELLFDVAVWIDQRVVFESIDALTLLWEYIHVKPLRAEIQTSNSRFIALTGWSKTNYPADGPVISASTFGIKYLLPKSLGSSRSQHFCDIIVRANVLQERGAGIGGFSTWGHIADQALLSGTNKTRIAILVPSKSQGEDVNATVLVRILLRSLASSITADEYANFLYTIYIGYDEGDSLIGNRQNALQSAIDIVMRTKKILVRYHQLPAVESVAFFWNTLFAVALQDGNDYFYQLNDDVELATSGWTGKFVKWLLDHSGLGVVGPNDRLWSCALLTQSFVSRRHWDLFGFYFPPEIKDWYSDNWISQVYGGDNTKCIPDVHIVNGAVSTRYDICDRPQWREALLRDAEIASEAINSSKKYGNR